MGTQVEVLESVSITKPKREDNELLDEVTSIDLFPSEVKILESKPNQSPEASNNEEQTANTPLAIKIKVDQENAITEAGMGTNQGESFLKSPPILNVATDDSSTTPEVFEIETLVEEMSKNQQVDIVESKEPSDAQRLISEEKLEQRDERGHQMEDEIVMLATTGENVDYDQVIEVSEIKEEIMSTSSEKSSYEDTHELSYNSSKVKEMESEKTQNKNEQNGMLHNGNTDVPISAADRIEKETTENDDAVEENTGSPYVTALIEENSVEDAELEQGRKLSESSSVEIKEVSLNEKENAGPNVDDKDESIEEQIAKKENLEGQLLESAGDETVRCPQEEETAAQKGEEFEIAVIEDIIEVEMAENKNNIQSLASNTEDITAKSSPECETTREKPEQEVPRISIEGAEDIEFQTIEQDNTADVGPSAGEEINEANLETEETESDIEVNRTDKEIEEQNIEESANKTDLPSAVTGDEIAFEKLEEDEADELKPKEEVKNVESESIESINVKSTIANMKGDLELDKDCVTQGSKGLSEEIHQKETNEDLVVSSSMPQVSQKETEDEDLDKEESAITELIEETSIMETEQEHKPESNSSDLLFEEKSKDIFAELAEANEIGQNTNIQIPETTKIEADEAGEETVCELEDKTYTTTPKGEDQREVTSGETSLSCISEKTLEESSAPSITDIQLGTTEVSATIDRNAEITEISDINMQPLVTAKTTEEKSEKKENEPIDPTEDTISKLKDIQMGNVNVEENPESVEPHELRSSIELVAEEKSNETCFEATQTKTDEDKENVNEQPNLGTAEDEIFLASDTASEEKIYGEISQNCQNENEEVESKSEAELQVNGAAYRIEEINDVVLTEEVLGEVEKAEESEYSNEQVANEESCATELQLTSSSDQEQIKVTSSDSVITENCEAAGIIEITEIEQLQEIEDINWEPQISSIAKAPEEKMEGTENPVIINRSASEPSEENIEEVDNNSLGVHAIPQGEAAENLESEDSSLRSELSTRVQADINVESMAVAKPEIDKIEVEELKISDAEPIIEITETAKLQDIKCEPEASAIEEASEEEILIGAEKPINFTISESALSEANTREENIDEEETAAVTVMAMETGSEGVQLANQSTRDMDTTAGDNDRGFDSTLQYEAVDAMELQDSSVISELATPEHADVNKEPVVIEKSATDEDEVEELKISDVEPNIGNAETEESQAVEGTNWETEASSIAEAPEEETMKDAEKPISITSSVSELSEENTRQEEIEEVGNHGYEAETAQATVITVETSSDEVQLANVSERSFDTTTGDNSLGSNAILHGEAVDGVELQDSCLISQLAITKHSDVNKETMVVEESATDETEVEEIEISNAEPNSYQQNVHHIHESEKISTVQSSDTNTYEEETYEVLERKSEAVDEEITEQFQTPSYETLLRVQELQTTTTAEKVEDESTMKEETLVNEKLESTIATNPNEETCLRASEVEISTLDLELLNENDSLGESSTQETTDPQVNISMIQLTDTISGGQENQELKDIEHISFQEHSTEETLDSANSTEGNKDSPVPHSQVNGMLPEEAPYQDLQEIERVAESASDLQRPEVLDKSEETEVKEELTQVAARESRENENLEEKLVEEEETINDDISSEKTEEIKEDAKDSSVVSLEVVHIQELAQELETIGENKDSTDEGKAAADTYQDLNADGADNSTCPQETEKERSVEEAITTLDLQDTNWRDANADAKSPDQEKKNPEAYEEPTSASLSMVQDKINETPLEPNKVIVDDNISNVEDNLESTEVKISEKDSKDEDIEMIDEVATESQTNQNEDCIEIIKDDILSEEIEGVTVETGEAKKSEDTNHEFNEEEICVRELQTTSSADGTANEIAYSDPVTVEKLESKDLLLETKIEELEATEDLNLESEASPIKETSEKEVKQGNEKPANIISSVLEVSVEESGVIENIDTQPVTLKSETSLEEVHEAEKLMKGSNTENQIEKADEANDTIENTHPIEKVADDEGVARTFMGTDSIEELSKDLPWIVAQEKAEENVTGAGKAIVNSNQDSVVEGTANENLLQEAPEAKNVNELPSEIETRETVNQTNFIVISEETIVLSEENAYSDPERIESLEATDLSVETEEDLNSDEALANEMNKHTENPVEITSPVVEVPEQENREEKLVADNITDTPAVTLLTETISEDIQQGEQLNANEVEAEELITSNRALASIGQDSKDVFEIDEVQEQTKFVPESIAEEKEVANDCMSSASVPIEELSEGLKGIDDQEKVEEHITGSEGSFVDSYQVSVAEGTANENPPQEINKEKDVKKAQSELELQAKREEPEGIEISTEPIVLIEENLETVPHEERIITYEYVANDQSDESLLDANSKTEDSKDQNLESTVEKIIGQDFQGERSEMNEEVGYELEEENEETQDMHETKRDVILMEEFSKEAFTEIQEVEETVNIKEEIMEGGSCTEELKITSESDEILGKIRNTDPILIENIEVIESSVNTEEVNLLTAEDFSGESGANSASKDPEEDVNQGIEKTTDNINTDSVEPKSMVKKENLEKADTGMNKESEILNNADADEIQVEESKEHDIEDVHRNGESTPGVSIGEDELEGRVFETELKYQADETVVEGGKIADLIHLATKFTEKSQESSSSEIICREQDRETTTTTEKGEDESENKDGTLVTELKEDMLTSRTIEAVLLPKENPNELRVSQFGFFEHDADTQNENPNEAAKEERSVVEEVAAVEPQEGEDNMKAGGSLIPKQMGIPGNVGEKCVEDASQNFQEIEEVLDFMPEAPSPNAATESEGTEIEEVHPNTATISLMDEEYQSQIANETTRTISKEVSSDKTTVEKEVAEDSVVVSPDEETIRGNYLEDELETLDYPEEITNQKLETTKWIPTEESSDELEKAGEIIEIAEHAVSEHIPTDEVYQDSFGDRTTSEILQKELKDENNLNEAPTELNLQELNNETGCTDRNTEDETVNEESNVSELELIKHDKDQMESIEKNNLSQIYEVQSRDFEVSAVADVASEEATLIDEAEVLAIAYKDPVQDISEPYEAKTDVEKEDISNPNSIVNEKPEQTTVESTYGRYVATESLIQRDQEKAKEFLDISEIEGKVDLTEVSEITLGVQMQDGPITKTLDYEVEELRAENDSVTELDTNRAETEEKILVEETKEQREGLSSAMFPLPDKVQTGECEGARKEDEEGDENQKMGSDSDGPVMIEVARDVDVKVHKKSHGILSGVGSKVKHSISKVKKVITGKSSHPKPPSPK